jgi:hypothetical protein
MQAALAHHKAMLYLVGCSMAKAPPQGFVYLNGIRVLRTDSVVDKVSWWRPVDLSRLHLHGDRVAT